MKFSLLWDIRFVSWRTIWLVDSNLLLVAYRVKWLKKSRNFTYAVWCGCRASSDSTVIRLRGEQTGNSHPNLVGTDIFLITSLRMAVESTEPATKCVSG